MNTSHTETASHLQRDALKLGNPFQTYKLVIMTQAQVPVAQFPFAGTLEQAESEAERLRACFVDSRSVAVVTAWFEVIE